MIYERFKVCFALEGATDFVSLQSLPHLLGDSCILESLIISLPHEDNLKKSPAFLVFYLQHSSVGSATRKKTNKLSRHMSIDMCCTAEQECSEYSLSFIVLVNEALTAIP
jgi:hypothetical protein